MTAHSRFSCQIKNAVAMLVPVSRSIPYRFRSCGVLEVVSDYDGDTYRAVFTVRFAEIIYVLHCFQKNSRSGISTPSMRSA